MRGCCESKVVATEIETRTQAKRAEVIVGLGCHGGATHRLVIDKRARD